MRRRRALLLAACLHAAVSATVLRAQRFDDIVREDFFAGITGDTARFDRAMKTCEDRLAADPGNAAALVWHGAGLLVRSGTAFRAGKSDDGMSLRTTAMREMNDANTMRPNDIQVLIPRAAILLASARFAPQQWARDMAAIAAADYEKVLAIETPILNMRGPHPRGELLGGLATAYRLTGNREKAKAFLQRISSELPGTAYDRKAQAWLKDPSAVKQDDHFCLGCHVK